VILETYFCLFVLISAENAGEGGLRAASDAGSPSSPIAKNGLEPHDGGDTAPKATEGQGGDAARSH
jgi:hypothetical protein